MICASIGRGRHRHMIAEHRHLADCGAKLVELRLDWINGEVNLKRLLADRPGPVMIACRREADGGKWTGSEAERLMLLRTAIAEGVEYIDLEGDVAGGIPRFGKTKRIVSYHNFRKTPDDLAAIHAQLAAQNADVVKLATMANQPSDNLRMLQLVGESRQPTVGFCMGDIGTPSRILCGRFGSPLTYATFHHERVLAPGQLSFQQMTEVYHYDRDRRLDGRLWRDRRSDRAHPQPAGSQRGVSARRSERGVFAVSRAGRVARSVFRASRRLGHSRTERDDSAQGIGAEEAVEIRSGREGNRRRQHDCFRERSDRRADDRLQHRLPRGDRQPGSGDAAARIRPRTGRRQNRAWCSAPAGRPGRLSMD